MCGIAGLYRADRQTTDRLAVMVDRQAHRGPDGRGVWCEEGIALGHRRLAILDLGRTGDQPMISADGRFVCVFNGEIYNYDELGAALDKSGIVRRGTSDTEVLLESFRIRGRGLIPDLRGMFAVAIWDKEKRELTLARDHFGKKPLYYSTMGGGGFAFASELTALSAVLDGNIDASVMADYLHFGYIPEPKTIYEDARALPPGSLAIWGPEAGLQVTRYWSAAKLDVAAGSSIDIDELEERIGFAIDRRLHSDVALGAFLSSGVDSALIASFLTERRPGAPTITIGIDNPDWDESPDARITAGMMATTHVVDVVSMGDAEALLDRYIRCYDQPFADSSGIPTLVLAEAARRHVTVALGGDGADEVFGGYDRYRWLSSASRTLSVPSTLRMSCAAALPVVGGHRGRRLSEILKQPDRLSMYRELMRVWHATPLEMIIKGAHARPEFFGIDDLSDRGAAYPQIIDLLNYLPFDILVKLDRATMRHGLECRSPFLDVDLVTWSASAGLTAGRRGYGKSALKELLARRLPEYDSTRAKRGFTLPIADWLAGPLKGRLLDATSTERLSRHGLFREDTVQRIVTAFLSGMTSFAFPLWALLVFQEWEQLRVSGRRP